jgi:hypothetical protein
MIWAVTAISGKAIPLDAVPTEDGNIHLDDGKAAVVKERQPGELLYKSHFATCPYAKNFRKERGRK